MTGMFFSIILDIRHIPCDFPVRLQPLLSVAGKLTIELAEGEAAVYMDNEFVSPAKLEMLNQILALNPEVQIAGENYRLTGTVQSTDLVTDSSITLSFALIVPDADFERFTENDYDIYLNAVLNPEQVAGKVFERYIRDQ